jgi:hypothetical protein
VELKHAVNGQLANKSKGKQTGFFAPDLNELRKKAISEFEQASQFDKNDLRSLEYAGRECLAMDDLPAASTYAERWKLQASSLKQTLQFVRALQFSSDVIYKSASFATTKGSKKDLLFGAKDELTLAESNTPNIQSELGANVELALLNERFCKIHLELGNYPTVLNIGGRARQAFEAMNDVDGVKRIVEIMSKADTARAG